MRQIVLDTETTGIDPQAGHRIIEIGCVELVDRKLTGRTYHQYINPDRIVEDEAIGVHGLPMNFWRISRVLLKSSRRSGFYPRWGTGNP